MQWARPKSLSGLMLLGLALIAVPLSGRHPYRRPPDPLSGRHRAEDRGRGRQWRARQSGVVQSDRLLERTARLYQVLGDDTC